MVMAKTKKNATYMTTGGERASYGLYFVGQNIFYIFVYFLGQSFFSWDCHHIVYWLVTPPLTGWKSNAVRLLPTAKNSRTI